jgi:dGTPase
VVKLSDAIAYINADVDDAVRAGAIAESDLPPEAVSVLGDTRSGRINTLVCDVVETSMDRPAVSMSGRVLDATNRLREFLFQNVYTSPEVKREAERAGHVVAELFRYFRDRPPAMPAEYQEDPRDEGVDRRVADYIAGMSDSYAIHLFQELFVPKMWPV